MSRRGSGFLGTLQRVGLVESDAPPPAEAAVPQPMPAPQQQAATLYPVPPVAPSSLTPEDEARLKTLEATVYATPSSYVIFDRVRAKLGNTSDLANVFGVLAAANPGVTPAKVMADIDVHLGIIGSKGAEFQRQIDDARASRIDGPAHEIDDLHRQNEDALKQIADRTTRIGALEKSVQEAQAQITDGATRFKLIADRLSAPLLQTKQILRGLSL